MSPQDDTWQWSEKHHYLITILSYGVEKWAGPISRCTVREKLTSNTGSQSHGHECDARIKQLQQERENRCLLY